MDRRERTRTAAIAWGLWLGTMALCTAGLVLTLVVTRPLTLKVLAEGAAFAVAFPLGYATIGLVLSLRRPRNPIGWLFATSGLVWSLTIPLDPWVDQLILDHRPLPLLAKVGAVVGEFNWAPAIAYGITLPALLVVPYLLIVPAAAHLAAGSGSLAVAAATLTAVALFAPLRRHIQSLVDRRFNRRRYDATRTVEQFAARLRDQVELDALHRELVAVVDQTMQPTRASLWLRPYRR